MSRRGIGLAVGVVVLAVVVVLVVQRRTSPQPTPTDRVRTELRHAPGVAGVRGSGATIDVRLRPTATVGQTRRVLTTAHRVVGVAIVDVRLGDAFVHLGHLTSDATADVLVALGSVEVDAQIESPAYRHDLVTVTTDYGAPARAMSTTRDVLAALGGLDGDGRSMLSGLLVRGAGQDIADYYVSATGIGEQAAGNRLSRIVASVPPQVTRVERGGLDDEQWSVFVSTDDRTQARRLWSRVGPGLADAGANRLVVTFGSTSLAGRPDGPFAAARAVQP